MNANLTLNGLVYTQKFSDKEGSERRNNGLGANLPRVLTIAHTTSTEGRQKLPSRRSLVRHDQTVPDGEGNPLAIPVSVYLVAVVPADGAPAAVDTAISDGLIAIRQLISGTGADASALNLGEAILENQEQ
jgi:hypothetical protein